MSLRRYSVGLSLYPNPKRQRGVYQSPERKRGVKATDQPERGAEATRHIRAVSFTGRARSEPQAAPLYAKRQGRARGQSEVRPQKPEGLTRGFDRLAYTAKTARLSRKTDAHSRLDWQESRVESPPADPVSAAALQRQLSAGDPDAGNLLVQGDNLLALKALLPYYAGKVKPIFNSAWTGEPAGLLGNADFRAESASEFENVVL